MHNVNNFFLYYCQISEESTGPPPTDAEAIDEESKWIRKQLESGLVPVLVKMTLSEQDREEMEDHIKNFLNFTHVQKLDVSTGLLNGAIPFATVSCWLTAFICSSRSRIFLCTAKRKFLTC